MTIISKDPHATAFIFSKSETMEKIYKCHANLERVIESAGGASYMVSPRNLDQITGLELLTILARNDISFVLK